MGERPEATSKSGPALEPLDWHFLQCFGERTPGEEIQEADIISAVEFDQTGQHLATGDRGGRVVLFERLSAPQRQTPIDQRSSAPLSSFEYRYLTEFQSHEPEFDYLKSLEIEEKINRLRWLNHPSSSRMVLSTNDKTIKLWKVYDRQVLSVANFNLESQGSQPWSIPAGMSASRPSPQRWDDKGRGSKQGPGNHNKGRPQPVLRFPQITGTESILSAKCRRVYSNAHTYHINSVSLSSDQETFLSADDLRINLWHLNVPSQSFNILDIKPSNMEDLTEVITAAEFHPQQCNTFAYSSSKGAVRMVDMRSGALLEGRTKPFVCQEQLGARTFFSEIISSISDLRFTRDGRFLVSRDYMTLKLWDIRMETGPVSTHNVHENLRSRLCDLYENDCIFDKFDCCVDGKGEKMATGSYSNLFSVIPRDGQTNDVMLEASRDPLRRRLQTVKAPHRFGISRSLSNKRPQSQDSGGIDAVTADFQSKLLHLAWHPEDNVIAGAASNSLYMFIGK